jgi:hypothetical protein
MIGIVLSKNRILDLPNKELEILYREVTCIFPMGQMQEMLSLEGTINVHERSSGNGRGYEYCCNAAVYTFQM